MTYCCVAQRPVKYDSLVTGGPSSGWVGNALCLDFVNTVDHWPTPGRDDLADPDTAWSWLLAAGLAEEPVTRQDGVQDLGQLVVLRTAIRTVFTALAIDEEPVSAEVSRIVDLHADHISAASWRMLRTHAEPVWPPARRLIDACGPVSDSAVRLLRAGPLTRVGQCPACGWLFVDLSKNGRRRWCSMTTCGSRSKSATYHAKARGGEQPMQSP